MVAATNKDLEKEVIRGRFREDLFYRLNVVKVDVPPLRERPEDIPLLVTHFLSKATPDPNEPPKRMAPEAMERLLAYRWPGNVRELENAIGGRAGDHRRRHDQSATATRPRVTGISEEEEARKKKRPLPRIDLPTPVTLLHSRAATEQIEKAVYSRACSRRAV